MRRIAANMFVFQQDSAPAQCARETVQLLQQETLDSISADLWSPNSPNLNPVDYRIWGLTQERKQDTSPQHHPLEAAHLTHGQEYNKRRRRSCCQLLVNGESGYVKTKVLHFEHLYLADFCQPVSSVSARSGL